MHPFTLLDAEREIRKCGRYAFRDEPKVAELFADMLGSSGGKGPGGGGGGGGPPPAT